MEVEDVKVESNDNEFEVKEEPIWNWESSNQLENLPLEPKLEPENEDVCSMDNVKEEAENVETFEEHMDVETEPVVIPKKQNKERKTVPLSHVLECETVLSQKLAIEMSTNTMLSTDRIKELFYERSISNAGWDHSCQFPNEFQYFQRNKHPQIKQMIAISEKEKVPYENVFRRFEQLRFWLDEKCRRPACDDVCAQIRRMFHCHFRQKVGQMSTQDQLHLHSLFHDLEVFGKKLSLGYVHLLMNNTACGPKAIEMEYEHWKKEYCLKEHCYPAGRFVISHLNNKYEHVYDHDYLPITSMSLRAYLGNRVLNGSSLFNRHPSNEEVLNFSRATGLPFLSVLESFERLRKLHKDECEPGHTCQRALRYFREYRCNNRLSANNKARLVLFSEFETFFLHHNDICSNVFNAVKSQTKLSLPIIQSEYSMYHKWMTYSSDS